MKRLLAEPNDISDVKNHIQSTKLQPASEKNPLTTPITYIKAATSHNTRKAYQQDIRHFINWGGILPTTAEIIGQYLTHYASQLNSRTLERRITGISQWHVSQSLPNPTKSPFIKKTLKGIKTIHGKPKKKATALSIEKLISVVEKLNQSIKLIDIRDNALLQLHFFGAFRRSELANLKYEDITLFEHEGIKIQISRSKTDQKGEGHIISIPLIKRDNRSNHHLCPVTALLKWLEHSKISGGPLFRSLTKNGKIGKKSLHPYNINCIIKKITSNYLNDRISYSSHSLRSGFATSAAKSNVPLHEIMKQGRWIKSETAIESVHLTVSPY